MISHQEKREELEASQGQDYEKMMEDEDFRPSDEEVTLTTKFRKIHLVFDLDILFEPQYNFHSSNLSCAFLRDC